MTITYNSPSESLIDRYRKYKTKCNCGTLNNGILNGVMPMPQKFNPSDNQESFAFNRKSYIQNVTKNYNRPLYTRDISGNGQKGIPLNNNTSSTVTEMRRIAAIGKSSTKNGKTINEDLSFKSVDNNTVRNARQRCRSRGYVVPPKVFNK